MRKLNKTGIYVILIICIIKFYNISGYSVYSVNSVQNVQNVCNDNILEDQSYGQFVPLDSDNLNFEFFD